MRKATFTKACITLQKHRADAVATALSELFWPPAEAVGLFENADGWWRVEATFRGATDRAALSSFLSAQGMGEMRVSYEDVPDADWVAISQAALHPVHAGRFIVHGSHDRERVAASRWAIEIEAAQAFGTAHHGSTRGCLLAIDDLGKRNAFARVLDIGTGTGVLAIAAARTFRATVIASDLDPVAVDIAKSNERRNGVRARVRTVTAPGLDHPVIRGHAPYSLVIANILARPLMGMAHEIARALRPGGIVVLSGITSEQAGRVAAAYGAAGFARLRRYSLPGWETLALRRVTRRR